MGKKKVPKKKIQGVSVSSTGETSSALLSRSDIASLDQVLHFYYVERELSHSYNVSKQTIVHEEIATCGTLFTEALSNSGARGPFENMIFPAMPLAQETLEAYKTRNLINPIVLIMDTKSPLLNELIKYRQGEWDLNSAFINKIRISDIELPALPNKPTTEGLHGWVKQVGAIIATVKDNNESLKKRENTLEQHIMEIKAQIAELKKQGADQKNEIAVLKKQVLDGESQFKSFRSRFGLITLYAALEQYLKNVLAIDLKETHTLGQVCTSKELEH